MGDYITVAGQKTNSLEPRVRARWEQKRPRRRVLVRRLTTTAELHAAIPRAPPRIIRALAAPTGQIGVTVCVCASAGKGSEGVLRLAEQSR